MQPVVGETAGLAASMHALAADPIATAVAQAVALLQGPLDAIRNSINDIGSRLSNVERQQTTLDDRFNGADAEMVAEFNALADQSWDTPPPIDLHGEDMEYDDPLPDDANAVHLWIIHVYRMTEQILASLDFEGFSTDDQAGAAALAKVWPKFALQFGHDMTLPLDDITGTEFISHAHHLKAEAERTRTPTKAAATRCAQKAAADAAASGRNRPPPPRLGSHPPITTLSPE
jgi:hypothetical protein